jgi:hypothetical protein
MQLLRIVFLACVPLMFAPAQAGGATPATFRVWVFADAHVGSDRANGRDSLALAIQQSEGPAVVPNSTVGHSPTVTN